VVFHRFSVIIGRVNIDLNIDFSCWKTSVFSFSVGNRPSYYVVHAAIIGSDSAFEIDFVTPTSLYTLFDGYFKNIVLFGSNHFTSVSAR